MCVAEYWGVVLAMRCVVEGTPGAEQPQQGDKGKGMATMSRNVSQPVWPYGNHLICLET